MIYQDLQKRPCHHCGGAGRVPLDNGVKAPCKHCLATGRLYQETGGWPVRQKRFTMEHGLPMGRI